MSGPTVIHPKNLDVFFVHSDEVIALVAAPSPETALALAAAGRGEVIKDPAVLKIEPSTALKIYAMVEVEDEDG